MSKSTTEITIDHQDNYDISMVKFTSLERLTVSVTAQTNTGYSFEK